MVSRSERKDSGQEKPDGLGSRVEAPAAAQQQVGTRAGRGGAGGKASGGVPIASTTHHLLGAGAKQPVPSLSVNSGSTSTIINCYQLS